MATRAKTPGQRVSLLVATRKGAFVLRADARRERWSLKGPELLGCVVSHMVADPRRPRQWLMGVRTGHLGPTVMRSADAGRSWREASRPPAFARGRRGRGRTVRQVFWLTPGHLSEPGVWYAGSSPHGLFRSEDGGDTWEGVHGFNQHPDLERWAGEDGGATPGGPLTHSVLVDPGDPAHLYLGLSVGGVFESRDRGASWTPLNQGLEADFLPPGDHDYGHDPHCMVQHPQQPNRLYQQNHCGIYRLDRPGKRWRRIGKKMPADVGDIGFPLAVHPRDPDTLWVVPMDGTTVWPRTSPGGRPAVYTSRDGGGSWQRQARGLPRKQAWLTVYRQALATDTLNPVGLYFGTSSGELWASRSEGRSWTQIASHLPPVTAVETLTGEP